MDQSTAALLISNTLRNSMILRISSRKTKVTTVLYYGNLWFSLSKTLLFSSTNSTVVRSELRLLRVKKIIIIIFQTGGIECTLRKPFLWLFLREENSNTVQLYFYIIKLKRYVRTCTFSTYVPYSTTLDAGQVKLRTRDASNSNPTHHPSPVPAPPRKYGTSRSTM